MSRRNGTSVTRPAHGVHVYFFHWPKHQRRSLAMQFGLRQCLRMAIAIVLVAFFIVPTDALAQSHVVSPADLQKEAVAASQVRQHNLESVQRLLSTPAA